MESLAFWAVVLTALGFDFVNGFNDAANSIATVVATKVLTPLKAVMWAAFFNFAAFLVFGTEVATTIAKDVVKQDVLSIGMVFAGLIGAIIWTTLCTGLGLPISASHSLVGGMAGAALAKSGGGAIVVEGFRKIGVFIVLSPLIGLALALVLVVLVSWAVHRVRKVERLNRIFRRLQLVSAAAFSLGHGANDAQKTMGVIFALLLATGRLGGDADVPLWVVLSAHSAIALGTLTGGWSVVHTVGSKITKLQPVGGVCAETAGAATLFFASAAGVPVSTTHTITGSIVGVGAVNRITAVRWGIAGRVVWAWLLTIPGSALTAAVTYYLVTAF